MKWLKNTRKRMNEMKQRGLERTLQMQAERQRKKIRKHQNRPEGALKAIETGMFCKSNPLAVMKKEYYRRKYKREQEAKRYKSD